MPATGARQSGCGAGSPGQSPSEGPGKGRASGAPLPLPPADPLEFLPQLLCQVEPQQPQNHFQGLAASSHPVFQISAFYGREICVLLTYTCWLCFFQGHINRTVLHLFKDNHYASFHLAPSFSGSEFPLSPIRGFPCSHLQSSPPATLVAHFPAPAPSSDHSAHKAAVELWCEGSTAVPSPRLCGPRERDRVFFTCHLASGSRLLASPQDLPIITPLSLSIRAPLSHMHTSTSEMNLSFCPTFPSSCHPPTS